MYRELTDDELELVLATAKPILDRNGGNPAAAKTEIQKALAGKGHPEELLDVFYTAADVIAAFQAERKERADA